MVQKLVSIIVPVYNIESQITKCLTSIRNQTYSNFEVIMIDDSSTDNSGSFCNKFADVDFRFKYYLKKNGGISSVRNYGVAKSKGTYISFIDGDDYVDKNFIGFLVSLLEKNDASIAQCGHFIQYSKKRIISKSNDEKLTKMNRMQAIESLCYNGIYDVTLWNKLFRREVFRDIYFPDGKLYEDTAVSYRLVENASLVVVKMIPKYFYVQRYNSIANGRKFSSAKLDFIDVGDEMADFIADRYPLLTRAADTKRCLVRLSTLSQMINSGYYNKTKEKELRNGIVVHFWEILLNKKTSSRDKAGVFLVTLGLPVYSMIWKMYYNFVRRR